MPSRLIKDPVRYKTVLCEKFLANGECPYGHKCQFAHGTDDLRVRTDKKKEKQEKQEKQSKRSRASVDAGEAEPSSAPAAPRAGSVPLGLRLPPGLGLSNGDVARKVVRWAPTEAVPVVDAPPSPTCVVCGQPPSPSSPSSPALSENESPQAPPLKRIDSGVQPKVGINSVTGKVEVPIVTRQASHNTNIVRRQLSLLFHDDEPDEDAPAPTSGAVWLHDHFGLPPVAGAA